ncbi:MAG: FtsX-like permease family protein [Pseudomonadaceae bacterium]|nr:MAG: FtsX-like permease family protein [Pseudomonadaceae bacterium]
MATLQRKLLRNLWTMKGQGSAIALVIATGIAMYVMAFSTIDSLRATQEGVYLQQRFADVFAPLKRAPEALAERLADIDGVAALETQVRAPLNIQLADFADPVTGIALSIPDGLQPALNQLYLRSGYLPDALSADQVVISEAFAGAHDLHPGDTLAVVINGRYRSLRISGVALSPEFIYQIRPGDLFPDFARYAVIWMNRSALAAAYGMEGSFNQVNLRLAPGSSADTVIARLDPLLASYGGLGAFARSEQTSHRYLEEELEQLAAMARLLPLIFIGVAAFLLNVVTARLIRTQREQIAVLKAFGYSNGQVGLHYVQWVMAIVLLGSLLGVAFGVWLADGLSNLYQDYFRFPWLERELRPSVVIGGVAIAAIAALLGTLKALQGAVGLPPAEAMRPEAPAHYRRTLIERLGIRGLSQPARMILRNLERQPVKSLLSVIGIAFAVALMMLTGFQRGSINHMLDVQFRLAQQQDVSVSFTDPVNQRALQSLLALPGVYHAEGQRLVPAVLANGHREYRGALQGRALNSQLTRVLDQQLRPIQMPEQGVLLTDHLARMLDVQPGDSLQVRVLDGRRQQLALPVEGVVTEFVGVGAYVSQDYLAHMLGEAPSINMALLAVDQSAQEGLHQQLEQMPRVLGVTLRSHSISAFNELMDESILVFTLFSMLLAGLIAFAVAYNNARVAFAERGRELASLRVLGFTRLETAYILLGELLLLSVLALLPGFALGALLSWLLTVGMQTDLYRVPLILTPSTFATAAVVVLLATALSALFIWGKLARLDMVSALKAAE